MPLDLQARRGKNASAPIALLPFELVSTIFEYAAASMPMGRVNGKLLPVLLSTCSFFRLVAISTPYLWTRIEYTDGVSWDDVPLPGREPGVSALAVCLDRSRTLDYQLYITMGRIRHDDGGTFAKLRALLQPHLHRCCGLYMDAPSPRELDFILPLDGNMPRLRQLSLDVEGDRAYSESQDISHLCMNPSLFAPQLSTIRSTHSDLSNSLTAASCPPTLQRSLLQLNIESETVDTSVLLTASSGFPYLITLKLTSSASMTANTSHRDSSLAFPRLRALSIYMQSVGSSHHDGIDGVHHIDAPNLTLLEFNGDMEEIFVPLFCLEAGLPKLEIVMFRECYPDMEGFEEFVEEHQSIKALSVLVDAETWLGEFGEMLSIFLSEDGTSQPNLPLLKLIQCECFLDEEEEALPLMMQMAKTAITRVTMGAPVLVNWINHEDLDIPDDIRSLELHVWSWNADYLASEDLFTFDEDTCIA